MRLRGLCLRFVLLTFVLVPALLISTLHAAAPQAAKSKKQSAGHVRRYYIAAEEVTWDFAPSGRNLMANSPIPLPYINTRYPKIRYIEYTDATFKVKKPQPEWLGILGPIIRAEVGDTVEVHFLNRTTHPLSIHPHGLRYTKENEGAFYAVNIGRSAPPVAGGQEFTYHWFADESSGPGPSQPSSIMWPYHSHVDEPQEVNAGLIGPIIVTARGKARPDGSPKDVDQEFVTLFMVFDQQQGKEAGMMHAINGYIFGNLQGLVVNLGSRVRWHVFAMGSERDIHTAHWHGKVGVTRNEEHVDVVPLLPAESATVDMVADNPGSWMFHCHVADHMEGGMMALFSVVPPRAACPVSFKEGNFWSDPHKVSFAVANSSHKEIKHINFNSRIFLRRKYLTPLFDVWRTDKPQPAGVQTTYDFPISMHDPGALLGWAISVLAIEYEDGSTWKPVDRDQCVHVYWKDGSTAQPKVLPPVQTSEEPD